MVTLVCKTHKTHSSVTLREFRKHSQKSLKIVKTWCKPTLNRAVIKGCTHFSVKTANFENNFKIRIT